MPERGDVWQVDFGITQKVRPERKEELQKHITGIVSRQGQKLIAIHCMPEARAS